MFLAITDIGKRGLADGGAADGVGSAGSLFASLVCGGGVGAVSGLDGDASPGVAEGLDAGGAAAASCLGAVSGLGAVSWVATSGLGATSCFGVESCCGPPSGLGMRSACRIAGCAPGRSGMRNGAANMTQPSTITTSPGAEMRTSWPNSFIEFSPATGRNTSISAPITIRPAPSIMKRFCAVSDMAIPQKQKNTIIYRRLPLVTVPGRAAMLGPA